MKKKEVFIIGSIFVLFFSINYSCFEETAKTVPNLSENRFYTNVEIKKELEIIVNSLQNSKYSYYDSCKTPLVNDQLVKQNNQLDITFVDLELLRYINAKDSSIKKETVDKWHFNRSKQFNLLFKSLKTKNKNASSNLWNEILNKRFVLILKERTKIMPRTNFEHYVLGGMFEGGAFLYDLENFNAICYFQLRYNNTSNKKEFYKSYSPDMDEAMKKQLIEQLKIKIEKSIAIKLGLPPDNIILNY